MSHGSVSSSSCGPPPGHTYLAIGQDFFSIQEYIQSQYNASLHRRILPQYGNESNAFTEPIVPLEDFVPAAVMTYTDIHRLRGLNEPADYGSGIEYAQGLVEAFPNSALQIGLWLNGTSGCRDILDGKLESQIHTLFEFIGRQKSSLKVFLRVGYEFDNPWFGFSDSPSTYQAAFRKLVTDCGIQLSPNRCHDKVAFVWHSWAAPRTVPLLDDFYPGDDVVDWVAMSIFQQLYPWANVDFIGKGGEKETSNNFAGGNLRQVEEVLEFAKAHDKPVMIAESTPFGGARIATTVAARGFLDNSTKESRNGDIVWNLWFQKTIDLIESHDIAMWSYINCDWDSQPMWHGIGFGDTRISSSHLVMANWWEKVLKNSTRFLNRMECNTGNSDSMARFTATASVKRLGLQVFNQHNGPMPWQLSYFMPVFLLPGCVILVAACFMHGQSRRRSVSLKRHDNQLKRYADDYGSCDMQNC